MNCAKLPDLIKQALEEDIGRRDITSELLIPKAAKAGAVIVAKEPCVICGLVLAKEVFLRVDRGIKVKLFTRDGQAVAEGKKLISLSGKARSILRAERVALNFLSLLSGIATKTREYVLRVSPYKVKIIDTRKTIPGLRQLQKYAVSSGGGFNHRMRLDEMVLIKDNHTAILRRKVQGTSYKKKIDQAKKIGLKVEIEVKSLKEFKEALKLKPDIIMLDNMSVGQMKKAVVMLRKLRTMNYELGTKLEASGGITLKNIRKVAATGVDMISLGDLTHSVDSIDLSLEITG